MAIVVPVPVGTDPKDSDLPGEATGFGYADTVAISHAGEPGVWSHLNSSMR